MTLQNLHTDIRANVALPVMEGDSKSSEYVYHSTLYLGGDFRPLADSQVEQAVLAGLYLHLAPGYELDLERWVGFAHRIQGIHIAGDGKGIQNTGLISEWTSLRSFVAPGVRARVDLSNLPNLEQVFARSATAVLAAQNRHVKFLSISNVPTGIQILAAVERLAIDSSEINLDVLVDVTRLVHLGVTTRGTVDLSPLADAGRLESLSIRCRQLLGLRTLTRLGRLRKLSLESIREAPDLDVIDELPLTWFEAEPNYLLNDDVRVRLGVKPGHWYVGRLREARPG